MVNSVSPVTGVLAEQARRARIVQAFAANSMQHVAGASAQLSAVGGTAVLVVHHPG